LGQAGQQLQTWVNQKAQTQGAVLVNHQLALTEYLTFSPIYSLHQILSTIKTLEIPARQGSVSSVSWSRDEQILTTGGYDGTGKLFPIEDLDALLAKGCRWLNSYLIGTPQALQKLTVCQTDNVLRAAAPNLMEDSEGLARRGDVEGAVAGFKTAQEWNRNLTFDPVARANELAEAAKREAEAAKQVEALNTEISELLDANQADRALTKLREAIALNSDIPIDSGIVTTQSSG